MILRVILALLFTSSVFFAGCSENEKKTEQNPVSQQAEQLGKEAAQAIKTPIEKAETVSDLEDAHNQALKDQSKSP